MKSQIMVIAVLVALSGCSKADVANTNKVVLAEDPSGLVSHAKPEQRDATDPNRQKRMEETKAASAAWWAEQNKNSSVHRLMTEGAKKPVGKERD